MWIPVGCSVAGPIHEAARRDCEDTFAISCIPKLGASGLLLVCSDGAGSVELGRVGAEITAQVVTSEVARLATADGELFGNGAWVGVVEVVRSTLEREAAIRDCGLGDLACTMVAAFVNSSGASVAQIGDGAIVAQGSDGTQVAITWPQHGEYANLTSFVTSPDALDRLEYAVIEDDLQALALFTDGLERLVLDFNHRTVPGGFLTPLWSALRSTDALADFSRNLALFLRSERIRSRTDDDITLVLGVRSGTSQE